PRGKMVVLGLISSKDSQLESQDQLLRRIDEAARYVPIDSLALSPQCGFASTAPGNLLTWDEQRRKLELEAQPARKGWCSTLCPAHKLERPNAQRSHTMSFKILLLRPDVDMSWPEKIRQAVPGAIVKAFGDPKDAFTDIEDADAAYGTVPPELFAR